MNNDFDTDNPCPWLVAVQAALSERTGRPLVLSKVANLVHIYEKRTVGVFLGDIAEQELYASKDPLGLLASRATTVLGVPDHVVFVPRAALRRHKLTYGPEGPSKKFPPESYFLTDQGTAAAYTYSSRKMGSLDSAQSDLVRQMERLHNNPNGPCTVVIAGEVQKFEDEVTRNSQAWFVGTVLRGRWEWDEDSGQLVLQDGQVGE